MFSGLRHKDGRNVDVCGFLKLYKKLNSIDVTGWILRIKINTDRFRVNDNCEYEKIRVV